MFLKEVENPIVFFGPAKVLKKLKEFRDPSMPIKWVEIEFKQMMAVKRFGYQFWQDQAVWEGLRFASAEMSIMWYEKKEFVKRTIEMNPYGTDKYLWLDVGCLRDT